MVVTRNHEFRLKEVFQHFRINLHAPSSLVCITEQRLLDGNI